MLFLYFQTALVISLTRETSPVNQEQVAKVQKCKSLHTRKPEILPRLLNLASRYFIF